MNPYLDALASARAQNATLRHAILIVAAMGALGMYYAHSMPKNLDLHLAPNVKAGDSVHVESGNAPVPDTNVYGFAYYIWQQVNRWQADGAKDYGSQIFALQAFVTPACRAQLEADMQSRYNSGELRSRTRQMTEIPGFGYSSARVVADGPDAWTVLLDMQLMESFRGQSVKDAFIRYPLRIVRYDVDREKNPWRMAIDCYGANRPARLEMSEVQAVRSGQAAPKLPTTLTPAALPRTADQRVDPNSPQATPLQAQGASASASAGAAANTSTPSSSPSQ
ncbi:TIGR03746 family integrating conjugative element protein [Acidovorax sp. SUPP1855]|uniref:PFL_4703 family integrating conjugative element protein n=1 Tax=Acidovorax sp. SUPP1855 TaxID=431774 RepID=UPI0023DE2A7B|nr:TIGR03746 family integrating conjugative element protein [Acidovorax sp. SUPP1855]GKS87587.1 TIGR03746 family integrating conjugative element protein [Acidovorax sp. SUPP1855]